MYKGHHAINVQTCVTDSQASTNEEQPDKLQTTNQSLNLEFLKSPQASTYSQQRVPKVATKDYLISVGKD